MTKLYQETPYHKLLKVLFKKQLEYAIHEGILYCRLTEEEKEIINSSLSELPDLEREVIKSRFGFTEKGFTEKIKSGLTQRTIDQALEKLKPKLQNISWVLAGKRQEEAKELIANEQAKRLFDVPITDFNFKFSVRTQKILKDNELITIGDLITKKESELMKLKNLGHNSLTEIKQFLSELNLSLGLWECGRRECGRNSV